MSRRVKAFFTVACLFAFAATLMAAPSQVGRDVSLDEANQVYGAVSCSSIGTTQSTWCAIECTWACFSTGCAACGCVTETDPGPSSSYAEQHTTPCGTAGCGSHYLWMDTCSGS